MAYGARAQGSSAGSAHPQAPGGPARVVAFGDSLTAGYGVAPGDAFPVKLQRALAERGYSVEIANAGVSGDTAAGGLARMDWSVPDGTEGVIVELGANDMLRGFDPGETKRVLDEILSRLKQRGMVVLLAGMRAAPNFGAAYSREFDPIFPDLAKKHDVMLYPFFLDGVATVRTLNQGDGLHPNAAGVDAIVRGILPKAEELVKKVLAARSS